jgi:hypothetical protein
MKKLFFAVPLVALLLAGCSTPAPTVDKVAADKPAASQAAKTADRSAALGGTVTYESGVKVTVKSDGFKPVSQYAYGAVAGKAAVFELTVVNGGKEELDAGLMSMPKVTVGAKNAKAEAVIDTEAKLGVDMLSTVLPGETQTVRFAAGIAAADAGVVRVEVMGPNPFTDKAAIFKGAVK